MGNLKRTFSVTEAASSSSKVGKKRKASTKRNASLWAARMEPETKYFSITDLTAALTGGTPTYIKLSNITVGDSYYQRDGVRCMPLWLQVRTLAEQSTSQHGGALRRIIFIDWTYDGTSTSTILNDENFLSGINPYVKQNITVLRDDMIIIDDYHPGFSDTFIDLKQVYADKKKFLQFDNSGCTSGSIFCLYVSKNTLSAGQLKHNFQLAFKG